MMHMIGAVLRLRGACVSSRASRGVKDPDRSATPFRDADPTMSSSAGARARAALGITSTPMAPWSPARGPRGKYPPRGFGDLGEILARV